MLGHALVKTLNYIFVSHLKLETYFIFNFVGHHILGLLETILNKCCQLNFSFLTFGFRLFSNLKYNFNTKYVVCFIGYFC